jgi:hypothetical protein
VIEPDLVAFDPSDISIRVGAEKRLTLAGALRVAARLEETAAALRRAYMEAIVFVYVAEHEGSTAEEVADALQRSEVVTDIVRRHGGL